MAVDLCAARPAANGAASVSRLKFSCSQPIMQRRRLKGRPRRSLSCSAPDAGCSLLRSISIYLSIYTRRLQNGQLAWMLSSIFSFLLRDTQGRHGKSDMSLPSIIMPLPCHARASDKLRRGTVGPHTHPSLASSYISYHMRH